jgi:hypothetical protein
MLTPRRMTALALWCLLVPLAVCNTQLGLTQDRGQPPIAEEHRTAPLHGD